MSNIDEQMQEYKEVLSKIDETTKLNKIPLNSEVDEILGMTYPILSKLSGEQCGEYAFLLTQYSTFLQVNQNDAKAKMEWAKSKILEYVVPLLNSYGDSYVKYEVKRQNAINEHEHIRILSQIEQKAQTVVTKLDFISGRINAIANTLLELQQTKRRRG